MAVNPKKRFTLMAFPQFFDGAQLGLNLVLLPRNQNPLKPAIEGDANITPDPPAFADALPQFTARILSGFEQFPSAAIPTTDKPLTVTSPTQAPALFQALAAQFQIDNPDASNAAIVSSAEAPLSPDQSVFKYLPLSYRNSFNFTTPRSPNGKTDDSYECAIRHAQNSPSFPVASNVVSWGAVFAHAMRQPLLARQLGMIYQTTLPIDASDFAHGGWLWIEFAAADPYQVATSQSGAFTARYAARIPALTPGTVRQVFAPMLLPVLAKDLPGDPDPMPDGIYDQVLLDIADYDDGFAKIVHTFQPRSMNFLAEQSDGAHPVKDAGIRLGWDDEQVLDWYLRQLSADPTAASGRLDAPLGVFGYAVDVAQHTPGAAPDWHSLTRVHSRATLVIPGADAAPLTLGDFDAELPYQVYPSRQGGDPNSPFWLPMYFANWSGANMVLPDDVASAVYGTTEADPNDLTGADGPAKNALSKMYEAAPTGVDLRYGSTYDFRIRMRDLSGGGPANDPAVIPAHEEPAQIGSCAFKRYVAPNQPRLDLTALAGGNVASDVPTSPDSLSIGRPLLNYPAVVYTGGYADPIGKLTAAATELRGKEAFGIPDPDVASVEITVEVAALRMDNQLSLSGKENYCLLYQTRRGFPAAANDDDLATPLTLPITYRDAKVLHFGADADLITDLQLPASIDTLTELVLPTARTIRLTLRAVCGDKPVNEQYFGLLSASDPNMDTRFGHMLQFTVARASSDETALFLSNAPAEILRGVYLQPGIPPVLDGDPNSLLLGNTNPAPQSLVQRLALEANLQSAGQTITGNPGERVQFGCSQRIRHTLSPDHSSLTFSTDADLTHHWLCAIKLELNRDWTWDAIADRSFVLTRTRRFTHAPDASAITEEIGTVELRHTVPFEALRNAQRTFTRLVFIDAVEPKPDPTDANAFPDSIEVSYSIQPVFKSAVAPAPAPTADPPLTFDISLPITTPPSQTPALASVGLALSPYRRNADYSASEPRQRFLWVELKQPIQDPQDLFFARVLASTPDQLISNNELELFIAPDIDPLPIDPELARVIGPGATNDLAGLSAMQPMEKAADSEIHYLLPLPPGLHPDSPEMFGFFTYEFRVGHYRREPDAEMSWTTAQGRFGRPLVVTGMQHPAPALTCTASHDEEKLYVSAPFATAVHGGRNVTADPPRTQLWCMLYAQVRQADGSDTRNILLDERMLDWRVQVQPTPIGLLDALPAPPALSAAQAAKLAALEQVTWKTATLDATMQNVLQLTEVAQTNRDATRIGTAVWSKDQVVALLLQYGLPETSSLSVIVVEKLPSIQNVSDFHSRTSRVAADVRLSQQLGSFGLGLDRAQIAAGGNQVFSAIVDVPSPFTDELGQHRILRTSPLTAVPFACCC